MHIIEPENEDNRAKCDRGHCLDAQTVPANSLNFKCAKAGCKLVFKTGDTYFDCENCNPPPYFLHEHCAIEKGQYSEDQKIKALTLRFRKDSLQAKLRDSKREFLFAGQSFYKLSNNPLLDPEDAED
jgi:hypothetical protein